MDNQSDINNLKSFGNVFQSKCLAIMLSDREFLERIIDIMSPDFWETDAHKWVVKFISTYFPTYREIPTMSVFACEIMKISDSLLQIAVKEQVKAAYAHVGDNDLAYIKEQFLEFCRRQKLKNAIWAAQGLLKKNDYDGIWHVINEASRAGVERDFGFDFCQNVDKCLLESTREVIKTNWELIDTHLDGGLGKGELGIICAAAGSGKSWALTRLGVEAMKQGKIVMHFTMELNAEYVGRRYASCITGIPFQEVRKHAQKVKDEVKLLPGRVFTKYFPLKTASAATLRMHIERFQLVRGIKIDLMIVDYADILRPFAINKNANSYTEAGSVYEELRSVLGDLQIPGWSASQANRSSAIEDIIEADGVADSYRKVMTADFIMSLARKTEDKLSNTGRIYIMKSRFGSDGSIYPCNFDASCGKMDIYDQKSVEGMEILNKTKTAQEAIKSIVRKRWRETHGEQDAGQ